MKQFKFFQKETKGTLDELQLGERRYFGSASFYSGGPIGITGERGAPGTPGIPGTVGATITSEERALLFSSFHDNLIKKHTRLDRIKNYIKNHKEEIIFHMIGTVIGVGIMFLMNGRV